MVETNTVKDTSQIILQELATVAELKQKIPVQRAELMKMLRDRAQVLMKEYVNKDPKLTLLDSVFIGERHIHSGCPIYVYRRAFVMRWDRKNHCYYNGLGRNLGEVWRNFSSFTEREHNIVGDGVVIKTPPFYYNSERFQENLIPVLTYYYEWSGSAESAIEKTKKLFESLRHVDDLNDYNVFLDSLLKEGE